MLAVEQSTPVERSGLRANAKEYGAYYTDDIVARFLVDWAVRSPRSRLLDPSFGGGSFLHAAAAILAERGGATASSVYGVELEPEEHAAVSDVMAREEGISRRNLLCADFFDVSPDQLPPMDAVVGNPPFIRYQSFSGSTRSRALARANSAGVRLSALSSSWAPFLVHSAAFLEEGGRIAMVAPMELAHASYAMPILDYLTRSFRELTIVTFRVRLFPDLSQDAVLLLANGFKQPFRYFGMLELDSAADLAFVDDLRAGAKTIDPEGLISGTKRLSTYYVDPRASELYQRLTTSSETRRLGELASVGIGYVTGANDFFHIKRASEQRRELPSEYLSRTVFRAKAFRGVRFTEIDWQLAADEGTAGYLLTADSQAAQHPAISAYLDLGKARGVPTGSSVASGNLGIRSPASTRRPPFLHVSRDTLFPAVGGHPLSRRVVGSSVGHLGLQFSESEAPAIDR